MTSLQNRQVFFLIFFDRYWKFIPVQIVTLAASIGIQGLIELYNNWVFLVVDTALSNASPNRINVDNVFKIIICHRFSAAKNVSFSNYQLFFLFVENGAFYFSSVNESKSHNKHKTYNEHLSQCIFDFNLLSKLKIDQK